MIVSISFVFYLVLAVSVMTLGRNKLCRNSRKQYLFHGICNNNKNSIENYICYKCICKDTHLLPIYLSVCRETGSRERY